MILIFKTAFSIGLWEMFVVLSKLCSVFIPRFGTVFGKTSLKIFVTFFSSPINLPFSSSVTFSADCIFLQKAVSL